MGGIASASWAGEELAVTRPWKPPVATAKTTMEVGLWHPWAPASPGQWETQSGGWALLSE